MFIVTLTYQRPLQEIDALMARHVVWLKRHYKSGIFIASGRQVPRRGGVILARSGNRTALEASERQPCAQVAAHGRPGHRRFERGAAVAPGGVRADGREQRS
jgi:uncharacterized protein YciI